MKVMVCKRTAMNFFTLFATWAANFILVIGRRFAVKSAVGIYDGHEVEANWIHFVGFTFDFQGEHPTSWEGGLVITRVDSNAH